MRIHTVIHITMLDTDKEINSGKILEYYMMFEKYEKAGVGWLKRIS